MGYAIINNNIVIAIVGIYPTNYKQFDNIVIVPYNIEPGDVYENGHFYRNGELVLTPEEILVQEFNERTSDMLNALEILGISDMNNI